MNGSHCAGAAGETATRRLAGARALVAWRGLGRGRVVSAARGLGRGRLLVPARGLGGGHVLSVARRLDGGRVPAASRRLAGAGVLAGALLTAACSGGGATESTETAMSAAARAYLTSALDTMQRHSVHRYHIDWSAFRADVMRRAPGAQTYGDTYAAIRFAIKGLGDNHSYFVEPGVAAGAAGAGAAGPWSAAATSAAAASTPPTSPPRSARVRERLGYLRVPGFRGSGDVEFAQQLQDMIGDLDTGAPTCGWIVDLRANTGGNMWPMLLGVGPLVGSGAVGHFVDPDSTWTVWHHRTGEVGIDFIAPGFRIARPHELRVQDPPVAVLTGSSTVSSGEAIAVAFRGRAGTRSFGAATAGLTTGIAGFRLADGAQLGLAVSVFADRTRRPYGGVLEPDERVAGALREDPDDDAVVEAAAVWLLAQERCRAD